MSAYPWADFGRGVAVSAAVALAVMLAAFVFGAARGRHRYVDIAWGIAFAAVAAASYGLSDGGGNGVRRLSAAALTCVWGLRLAVHIGLRGRGRGEDPRYERLLAPGKGGAGHTARPRLRALAKVYLPQAALVVLVSLPVQAAQYLPQGADPLTYAGCALWLIGLYFEAVGDHQLAAFTADPANKGRIMQHGLWSWTRHPNYFGDFCVWWGLFLLACGTWQTAAATVAGPVVMSLLLTLGSGKRLLEKHMEGRPGYDAYRARTSGFLPMPPGRRAP